MKMKKEMKDEIAKAAEKLGMSEEDALAKYEEICQKNGLDPSSDDDFLLARGLWRTYFSNSMNVRKRNNPTTESGDTGGGGGSFFKQATGFFCSLEEARDMMALQRDRIVAEYQRDSDTTFSYGKVALFSSIEDDKYEARMMKDGEEVLKVFDKIPENHVELDDGQYLVPIDTNDADWNKARYGKPLPKSEWRRSGVFIGSVDGSMGKYFFDYKGLGAKAFEPNTFEFLHFTCILNSNDGSRIHGAKMRTVESLALNADLDDDHVLKTDTSDINMLDALAEYSEANMCPLIELDRYHTEVEGRGYNDKFVFTDGVVTTLNMTKTKNGNRILVLDDLETDFSYDGGSDWTGVACWIPERVNIEFGIGSSVVVVGRTSQGTDDDGNLRPVTINVSGLLVQKARGGSPDDIEQTDEESEWFFD
tara:strand:+ start:6003 stop:7262 length:1260 start_codon:yes stop_codon:yes gene_type:complete